MIFTWTFIGFVLCSLVCMWLFAQKQRPLFWGFLLGLFLGLIGIVIALLLPPKMLPNYTSFLAQTKDGWQWQSAAPRCNRTHAKRRFVHTTTALTNHEQRIGVSPGQQQPINSM